MRNGMRTLSRSRDPIRKGLNTDTRVAILFGLKLFKLAMFPTPKNETTAKKTKSRAVPTSPTEIQSRSL